MAGSRTSSPPGIGAERRHHQPVPVEHEAGAAHAAASCRHRRLGMVVAGDLALCARRGLVAKDERGGGEGFHPLTADALWRRGIVVALDPDEAVRLGHGAETGALARREAVRAIGVVEAVAEGDHHAGLVAPEQQREAVERGAGVPRRQELAAARVGGAFLQVQVGDREQAGGRPVAGRRRGRASGARRRDGWGRRSRGADTLPPTPSRKGRGRSLCLCRFSPPPLAGGGWGEGATRPLMNRTTLPAPVAAARRSPDGSPSPAPSPQAAPSPRSPPR